MGKIVKLYKNEDGIDCVSLLYQNGSINEHFVSKLYIDKDVKPIDSYFAIGMEIQVKENSKINIDLNNKIGRIISRFRGGTFRILFENKEIFNLKENDLIHINSKPTINDLNLIDEKYKKILKENSNLENLENLNSGNLKFKLGDIVKIKDTTNLKKRLPNRMNQLGSKFLVFILSLNFRNC